MRRGYVFSCRGVACLAVLFASLDPGCRLRAFVFNAELDIKCPGGVNVFVDFEGRGYTIKTNSEELARALGVARYLDHVAREKPELARRVLREACRTDAIVKALKESSGSGATRIRRGARATGSDARRVS